MSRGPGKLLNLQIDIWMLTFEGGQQIRCNLTFPAHGPEPEIDIRRTASCASARYRGSSGNEELTT
jgi:hypothetical protein